MNADETVPRRSRRAPRRVVNYYVKLAGYIIAGGLGAVLVWAFVVKVIHPYQLGWAVEQDIRAVRADLRKQNARNAALQKRLAYLQTPAGAETEARRAGFARPGEMVYLLRKDEPAK